MRLTLLSLIAALLATGCVVQNRVEEPRPTPPRPGHISFTWNFEGKGCLEVPEVRWVRVIIPNEQLENDGYFPCNTAGIDGIKLLNFRAGNYNFTVDGVDANNKTIYTASGTLAVNGDITVPLTLSRVGAREQLQIYWTFGKGQLSCEAAGVDEVWVRFGNDEPVSWPCRSTDPATGIAVEGLAIKGIDAGTYPIELQGVTLVPSADGSGGFDRQVWYGVSLNLPVAAGVENNFKVKLDDVAAWVTFKPSFSGGHNCFTAGVDTLAIRLFDRSGQEIGFQYTGACTELENGITWDYLPAADSFDRTTQLWTGTYTVQIEGWDSPYTNHRVLVAGQREALLYAGVDNTITVPLSPVP